jgi:hypothetical protein
MDRCPECGCGLVVRVDTDDLLWRSARERFGWLVVIALVASVAVNASAWYAMLSSQTRVARLISEYSAEHDAIHRWAFRIMISTTVKVPQSDPPVPQEPPMLLSEAVRMARASAPRVEVGEMAWSFLWHRQHFVPLSVGALLGAYACWLLITRREGLTSQREQRAISAIVIMALLANFSLSAWWSLTA